jgi:hypothetical protein
MPWATETKGASAVSKTITLELPEEIYEAVKEAAGAAGKQPAEWITHRLEQLLPGSDRSSANSSPRPDIETLLRRVAAQWGRPLEEVRAEFKAACAPKPRPQLTEEERQAAWEQLSRHFGAVNSGDPYSSDNRRIDEDLAREYESTHEDQC